MHYVFVYGSLKRKFCNHGVMQGAKFIGNATTKPKYQLLDLGRFPGLIECDNGLSVVGEVFSVSDDKLKQLDRFEGKGYLYDRMNIDLENIDIDESETIIDRVQAYFYLGSGDRLCGSEWKE